MTLFLHFLNREPYRATQQEFSAPVAEDVLRVLCIGCCNALFTNYSNLLESQLLLPRHSDSILLALIQIDQVLIDAERPTVSEFIESRAGRYKFDSARYPMYFGRHNVPDGLLIPWRVRSASITRQIEQDIFALHNHERSLIDIGVAGHDASAVREVLSTMALTVRERGERAITRSLFRERITTARHANATARLISSTYIKRHLEDLNATIISGVPALRAYDHLASGAWEYDYPLLKEIIRHSGLGSAFNAPFRHDREIAAERGSAHQRLYAEHVHRLCRALQRRFSNAPIGRLRPAVSRLLNVSATAASEQAAIAPLMFDKAIQQLRDISANAQRHDRTFADAHETEMNACFDTVVLIVTATKVETQALLKSVAELAGLTPTFLSRDRYVAREFGEMAGIRIVHVQCEAGSVGPSSSQAVVSDAIRDFMPRYIIMGGIAFGLDRTKQQLGDILVSRVLVEYEKAKLKSDAILPRGQRLESDPKLLNMFRAAEAETLVPTPVHVGTLLSGEKLVDSEAFVEKLLQGEPEAIGGEMEGAGLVAAASRNKVPWIVVKAIVDWGANKSANNTQEHQVQIARNAFDFIMLSLVRVGL